MAKNNQIYWIIGIIILAVIILPKLDAGLFATQEICVSNEPITLEGYKDEICDWTIGGESNTKCRLTDNQPIGGLAIAWGGSSTESKGDLGEGADILIGTETDMFKMGGMIQELRKAGITKERTKMGIDIFSFPVNLSEFGIKCDKLYYFCSSKKAKYNVVPDINYQVYYNLNADVESGKCVYLRHPNYLDYPCETDYIENLNFCEKEGFPCVLTFIRPRLIKEDYICLLYTDTAKPIEIEDKYFNTFYTCEEEQIVCTTDTKQCPDGSYVSRNPNNNCQFYTCPTEVKWYNDVLYTSDGGFDFKLWMLLSIIGGIILIVLMRK